MQRFSIIVPAYNAEATLAETLEAIIGQEYADWECIVVDDGSTDGTLDLARRFAKREARVRVIHQQNRGSAGAYNTGAREAAGEWICICSADDVLLPLHLATMAQSIDQHPGYDILSCNGYYWHADGVRQIVYPPRIGAVSESWSLEDVLRACFFSVGACYRRDLFDTVGGYPEGAFGEDYIFWMRAMAHGAKHLYVSEALALHRISATQKSADLRASYESDIESIASVMSSGQLSVEQMRVARAAIWHRRRMIFGLRPFGGLALRLLRLLRSGLQDARSR